MRHKQAMKQYTFAIWSYKAYTKKSFENIFKNSIFEKLIFPSRLYKNPEDFYQLNIPSEFSPNLIPEEFTSKETARTTLFLHPENEMSFSASFHPSIHIAPNTIILRFTSEHIQNSVCSIDDFINLVKEGIPGFEIGQASLYDSELIKIPELDGSGGHRFYKTPHFKRPTGGDYSLSLEWLTYFGEDYLNLIGRKRFENLKTYYLKQEISNGILVVLQSQPFDVKNLEHIARQKKAEDELAFYEFAITKLKENS